MFGKKIYFSVLIVITFTYNSVEYDSIESTNSKIYVIFKK